LNGVVELQLKIRQCRNKSCMRYKKAYRPEQEGSLALPQNEFGLDVIAYIGALRYQEHRSVPQIHAHLELKGICISQRTVTHLIDRYDELLSLWLKDHKRLKAIVANALLLLSLNKNS
ncbi:MAG: ISNCY family transposase, partial [Nostoc sp.]